MAKGAYIGVGGVARKIKKGYSGVSGVARNIKSGYMGIGGVARQFLSGADPVLNNNSWATIRSVSDAGQGENYWAVGDTKTIIINGKVGETTFTNLSVNVFILGFNHNSSYEGTNRIHFKIGKINDRQVALIDANYNTNITGSGYFTMNISNSNSGGWSSSAMRKNILGNSGTPTSPASGSLMAALPSDLLSVMKPVTKYSDNVGTQSGLAGNVTSTTDYLFLLSEFEYFGTRKYANTTEQNYQKQYDYYKNGNEQRHFKHNATTPPVSSAVAWCRSSYPGDNRRWCRIDSTGATSIANAIYSYGIASGFVV